MFYRRSVLLIVSVFLIPGFSQASDGVIRFSGQVIEPTCVVQTDKDDKALESTSLKTCSKEVASNTSVTTEVMTPNAYMVPWRANDTVKRDVPVAQWKVVQVVYD